MEQKIIYPELIDFIRATIEGETGLLLELEQYAQLHKTPIIQPESAALLKILVKLHKPKRILEVGTAIGYSASIMMKAMGESGIIDTIEINEDMANIAINNIKQMGSDGRIRVIIGDAIEVMECLSSSYDMIFLDAAKGQYSLFFYQAMRLLNSGGILISDNILYKGLVAQGEGVPHKHRTIAVRLKNYLYEICHDNRLETSIIPLGDGMAISLKKGE